MKKVIAKLLGLKVIDVNELKGKVLNSLVNDYYDYKKKSPSRNSANITDERLIKIGDNIGKVFEGYK